MPYGMIRFSTTTNVAGSSTAVISTTLANRYSTDDYFNGEWWAVLEQDSDDGTPANNGLIPRRVTDYAGSTGTLTLSGANLSSEDEATDWILIKQVHPEDIKVAYNLARMDVFPSIGIMRSVESLVTGIKQRTYTVPSTVRQIRRVYLGSRLEAQNEGENLFSNGGVEDWTNSTSLDNWSAAGTGVSVNQEQSTTSPNNYMVLAGDNSARLVLPGSDEATLLQTVTPSVGTQGVEANVSAWVYSQTASRISARIASTDGTAHGGTGWERIKVSATLGATATNLSAGIAVSSGAALSAYVDELLCTLGPSEGLEQSWTVLNGWKWIPPVDGGANGGVLKLTDTLPSRRRIKFEGLDVLSAVTEASDSQSVDSTTIEVDKFTKAPVLAKMREYLSEMGYRPQWAEERAVPTQNVIAHYRNEYTRLVNSGRRVQAPPYQFKPAATA